MGTLPLLAFTLTAGTFDTDVRPVLTNTCAPCHNQKLASGGLNVNLFTDPASILSKRDGWEAILARLRSGEMPAERYSQAAAGSDYPVRAGRVR